MKLILNLAGFRMGFIKCVIPLLILTLRCTKIVNYENILEKQTKMLSTDVIAQLEKEKVNERVVVHKTHNAETIEIRNPSEKLLAFMDELAERARKRKEEIMKKIYKEEDYITI